MKYLVKDIMSARGIRRITAIQLARRHRKGTLFGGRLEFTQREYEYLCGIKNWNHKTHS